MTTGRILHCIPGMGGGGAEPLKTQAGLLAEETEHLALERALAERVAGKVHEVDGPGGRRRPRLGARRRARHFACNATQFASNHPHFPRLFLAAACCR